ncbi:MAG: uroporphyrinogen-III C-methyltransferase [Calothrix sp. SM1_5_4]|nr:uroporphyrinogen-III C-methyltransferase [Calothrix sp. SM1_5_4]
MEHSNIQSTLGKHPCILGGVSKEGKVFIVGAGPGDPELLTLKALRVLRIAEVVLYDSLLCDGVLDLVNPEARLIHSGKRCGAHVMSQEEINRTLVEHARNGLIVVRLKGGDPFVFGRAGEEIIALRERNIPYEIVPGVSSSIAAGAYAGVPITHRNVACSFAVITGHEDPAKLDSQIQWDKIVGIDTLVILMGVKNRGTIARKLIQYGRSPDNGVIFVSHATLPNQEVVRARLGDLPDLALEVETPAVMITGAVVNFDFSWFEPRLQLALSRAEFHQGGISRIEPLDARVR